MNYIKTDTLEYPISFNQIRKLHPQVSFPADWGGGKVEEVIYMTVESTTPPTVNSKTENLNEGPPQKTNGVWRQTWFVEAQPTEEVRPKLHRLRKKLRTQKETAGFEFRSKIIDSDRDSILRITQAAAVASQKIQAGLPYNVDWVCQDDSILSLDAVGVLEMQQALASHGYACHVESINLKSLIDNETITQQELNALFESIESQLTSINISNEVQ
jgi:hypothetical protein